MILLGSTLQCSNTDWTICQRFTQETTQIVKLSLMLLYSANTFEKALPLSSSVSFPIRPQHVSSLLYDLGFSFFSFHSADRPTPDTFTTLNRTPGISPLALPFRPKPESSTSSFSSTKFKQPSFGTIREDARLATDFVLKTSCTQSQS